MAVSNRIDQLVSEVTAIPAEYRRYRTLEPNPNPKTEKDRQQNESGLNIYQTSLREYLTTCLEDLAQGISDETKIAALDKARDRFTDLKRLEQLWYQHDAAEVLAQVGQEHLENAKNTFLRNCHVIQIVGPKKITTPSDDIVIEQAQIVRFQCYYRQQIAHTQPLNLESSDAEIIARAKAEFCNKVICHPDVIANSVNKGHDLDQIAKEASEALLQPFRENTKLNNIEKHRVIIKIKRLLETISYKDLLETPKNLPWLTLLRFTEGRKLADAFFIGDQVAKIVDHYQREVNALCPEHKEKSLLEKYKLLMETTPEESLFFSTFLVCAKALLTEKLYQHIREGNKPINFSDLNTLYCEVKAAMTPEQDNLNLQRRFHSQLFGNKHQQALAKNFRELLEAKAPKVTDKVHLTGHVTNRTLLGGSNGFHFVRFLDKTYGGQKGNHLKPPTQG